MKALVEPGRKLTSDELLRYSRHLLLPNVDLVGQERLVNAKVLCIGAGGLGSPTILYLAAAGIGTIGIVDFEKVELSNLQRQIIHTQADVGKSKVLSAAEKARALNPDINLILHELRIDESNAVEVIQDYDLIIDCTDNFATRYLINDAAALLGKPYVWASIYRFDGQVSVFWSKQGPCYRCLHPTPPPVGMVPSCAEGGVLGALCGTIGALQSTEAIKLITGVGEALIGQLQIYDALESTFHKIQIQKSAKCEVCNGAQKTLLPSYEAFCNGGITGIDAHELKSKLTLDGQILLIDVREPNEHEAGAIAHSHLMPVSMFEDGSAVNKIASLSEGKEIVLYCQSGVRSAKCLAILQASGYLNSRHLAGGMAAWELAGVK